MAQIRIDDQVLSAFCQRHHIRWLALFGSALRPEDFRPDSDLDVLVDFEPGHVPGFAFVDLADELSVLLGRRVDLHTPASQLGVPRRGSARSRGATDLPALIAEVEKVLADESCALSGQ